MIYLIMSIGGHKLPVTVEATSIPRALQLAEHWVMGLAALGYSRPISVIEATLSPVRGRLYQSIDRIDLRGEIPEFLA